MEIKQSNVRKIEVSNIKGLDPVSIYLEDFEPRKGKITISCWNKTWHSYWGGMGDNTISDFFLSCDNYYIAKNLSNIKSTVDDYDELKRKLIEELDDDDSELWDIEYLEEEHEWVSFLHNNNGIMQKVYGEEWWYDIPKKENHEYTYLCKIIDVTKEVLKEVNK